MGELLAALVWVAAAYFAGRWDGNRRAEKRFLAADQCTRMGKCQFCGTQIEGGSLDLEAHERFYCKPPKPAGGS